MTGSTTRTMGMLLTVLILSGQAVSGQTANLPVGASTLFTGSGNCASCHGSAGSVLTDGQGTDVSMVTDWRSTMMAHAAQDPLWQAKVESEVQENPALQAVIETKCTTCHTPQGRIVAMQAGAAGYTLAEARRDPLAMDGVSCTLCHQIQPAAQHGCPVAVLAPYFRRRKRLYAADPARPWGRNRSCGNRRSVRAHHRLHAGTVEKPYG